MRYVMGKVFYDTSGVMKCISYDNANVEYYSFLRECRNNGLHQVIITSEMMIELIKGLTDTLVTC